MAVCYKTKGIVFGKRDLAEADRVFKTFTYDFGKLEIFGKAIRKINSKLKAGIDIFSLSEIEFIQGKNKKTLTDAVLIKTFSNVVYDLDKFKIATDMIRVLDVFLKGQEKDEKLFKLLEESLGNLNNTLLKQEKNNFVYYYFLWNTLSLLGHAMEVESCAGCSGKLLPFDIYFSAKEGGVICGKCLGKDKNAVKVNSDIVKILRIILSKNWGTFAKLKTDANIRELLFKISKNLINFYE